MEADGADVVEALDTQSLTTDWSRVTSPTGDARR